MCELCSDNKSESAMAYEGQRTFAHSLERLAHQYEQVANRRIKPHSEEWLRNRPLAMNILRNLVNDWI